MTAKQPLLQIEPAILRKPDAARFLGVGDPASAGFVVVGRYRCKNTPASMMPDNTMNSAGSMMQHTAKMAMNRPFTAIQP